MVSKSKEEENNWRNIWLVKALLAPLPVFGPFFKVMNCKHVLYHSGKQITMLLGGTTIMLVNLVDDEVEAPYAERYAKGVANMALGMGSAAVFYDASTTIAQKFCLPNETLNDPTLGYNRLPV